MEHKHQDTLNEMKRLFENDTDFEIKFKGQTFEVLSQKEYDKAVEAVKESPYFTAFWVYE